MLVEMWKGEQPHGATLISSFRGVRAGFAQFLHSSFSHDKHYLLVFVPFLILKVLRNLFIMHTKDVHQLVEQTFQSVG